jgi:hypothetical protein
MGCNEAGVVRSALPLWVKIADKIYKYMTSNFSDIFLGKRISLTDYNQLTSTISNFYE